MTTSLQLSRNSLRNLELMNNSVSQIKDYFHDEDKIILIASSMGDIPNRIEDMSQGNGGMEPEELLQEAYNAYHAIGDKKLIGWYDTVNACVNSHLSKTEKEPITFVAGEMLSGRLLEYLFNGHGLDAEFVNLWSEKTRPPLVAKGNPLSAIVDLRRSKKNTDNFEIKKRITIFPGYCGLDSNSAVKLLGHGGSKTAAVAYGYMFDADRVWLCDTEYGIKEAHIAGIETDTVPELGLGEAVALANFGAYLKTGKTLEPLYMGYEPIEFYIANSQDLSGNKTRIVRETSEKKVSKIVAGRDVELCNLRTSPNVRLGLEKELGELGVDYKSWWNNPELTLIITSRNKNIPYRIIKGFEKRGTIEIDEYQRIGEDGCAMVGIIGSDLANAVGIAEGGKTAITNAGISVKDTLPGGNYSMIYLVERSDRPQAEKALYREFINPSFRY